MNGKTVPATAETIRKGAEIIRNGGLVIFPTETVYGLGADALNPVSVARIFEAKRRPRFDPLIVHIDDIADLDMLTSGSDERVRVLAGHFWPGPLTLVLPRSANVPDIITSGLPSVAVRMPSHQTARELIAQAGTPVAAPSANIFGSLSPTSAGHISEELRREVDLILDGGRSSVGVESTVLSLTGGEPTILRFGGTSKEEIESRIGRVRVKTADSSNPESPGQCPKHYAPDTGLVILRDTTRIPEGQRMGLITLGAVPEDRKEKFTVVRSLSSSGDLREAASNLFSLLHELDQLNLDLIAVQAIEERGLGAAIMDRLRRASWRGEERT